MEEVDSTAGGRATGSRFSLHSLVACSNWTSSSSLRIANPCAQLSEPSSLRRFHISLSQLCPPTLCSEANGTLSFISSKGPDRTGMKAAVSLMGEPAADRSVSTVSGLAGPDSSASRAWPKTPCCTEPSNTASLISLFKVRWPRSMP